MEQPLDPDEPEITVQVLDQVNSARRNELQDHLMQTITFSTSAQAENVVSHSNSDDYKIDPDTIDVDETFTSSPPLMATTVTPSSTSTSLSITSFSPSISSSSPSNSTPSDSDLVALDATMLPREVDNSTISSKKSLSFGTVTVYHFTRSQGFISIPSQGGSTLGMKRRHFRREKLSVNLFEEVRRRSRREILLKIKYEKEKSSREHCDSEISGSISPSTSTNNDVNTSPLASSTSSSSSSTSAQSNSDEESSSDYSDISDSELESDFSFVFCQPIDVKLRRSLLRASGVGRIDPKEKWECKFIRESRENSGCRCVNQCIPGLCECSRLGVNCHVDRVSFPCGCISAGCRNPLGRTEFDVNRVKGHSIEKLLKSGIG